MLRPLLAVLLAVGAAGLAHADASADHWPGYQIIEWQPRNPAQLATLKRIGVTAAMVPADRSGTGPPLSVHTAPLQAAGLRWYIENIATDFYSQYHRFTPGRPVNWRFLDVQHRYRADPDDLSALVRDPSLSDPDWQARIDARLTGIVREEEAFHPLFYNLGDETGIADLSAFWDFDLSSVSLAGMRVWLASQYGTLDALNAEWGTHFAAWSEVQPETTIQAMRRTDDNFAAWADFKAWMDVAFADALRRGTDAVHAADPDALAGIEGAQIPGWGGYDYTLLSHAVDLMEIYDDGENLPIVRSLNPLLVTLTTSFGASAADIHQIWRELLRGTRGLVLWDDNESIVRADGSLGERGAAYAALFPELRRIANVLIGAPPHIDPVAVLYSPASFRTQWMLDQRPKGLAWTRRTAGRELKDNAFRVALRGYVTSLSSLGLRPRFVSSAMLAGLRDAVLILPDVLALSPEDARAIAGFSARGGVVIADTAPGIFDAHSRRLADAPLAAGKVHLIAPEDRTALAAALSKAGVTPVVRVVASRDDVDVYVFQRAGEEIVGLQLRDVGDRGETVELTLPGPAMVSDLRSRGTVFKGQTLRVALDPAAPAVLGVDPATPAKPLPPTPSHKGRGDL
jgi:hypothetical protein